MKDDDLLIAVLRNLGSDESILDRFLRYHDLLIEWNRRVNLVSRNDERLLVRRHFIDSLSVLKAVDFPEGCRLLDMGTGAGFPGIPIRLARPDIDLVLLESKRKKVLFLKQLLKMIRLDKNVPVICARAESSAGEIAPVDVVCSRAVADTASLIKWSLPLLKETGRIVALKGPDAATELAALPEDSRAQIREARLIRYEPFPGILNDSWRHVVDIHIEKQF
ncbi:16S rRNA (guanine(527)-N(7))-methyltransferase RsmG [bacterium]|nr:16S rRNA (guanine(527)-N(7))-methyltransferase RsmG [bacterium]